MAQTSPLANRTRASTGSSHSYPDDRSSMTTTLSAWRSSSRRTSRKPIAPAPPVTTTVFSASTLVAPLSRKALLRRPARSSAVHGLVPLERPPLESPPHIAAICARYRSAPSQSGALVDRSPAPSRGARASLRPAPSSLQHRRHQRGTRSRHDE